MLFLAKRQGRRQKVNKGISPSCLILNSVVINSFINDPQIRTRSDVTVFVCDTSCFG